MAKLRIYELARELGLDNKVVLDMCEQMSIGGKSSHSNTLSDEEADRIRRSLLRKALSEPSVGHVRESKVGGQVVTERRFGDVIRRRRKPAGHEGEADDSEHDGRELFEGTESHQAEHEVGGESGSKAVGEELFDHEAVAPDLSAVSQEEAEQVILDQEESPFPVETSESVSGSEQPEEESQSFEVPHDVEVSDSSAAIISKHVDNLVERESVEGKEKPRDNEELQVQEEIGGVVVGQRVFQTADLEEARKRLDIKAPKVLGRIDLPVIVRRSREPHGERRASGAEGVGSVAETRTRGVRTEATGQRTDARGPQPKPGVAAAPGTTEAGAPGAKPKSKGQREKKRDEFDLEDDQKKPKRKQILKRDDLLDYESDRDGWRTRKDKKSRKDLADPSSVTVAAKASKRVVKIEGEISVGEIARQMSVKSGEVIKKLMGLGIMANINQLIDFDTATLICSEFEFTTVNTGGEEEALLEAVRREDTPEDLVTRPPVITVMGHVDHGKTSLLDAIRKTSVTKHEAGGITQHIGAYSVTTASGGVVTFIDTPGHEAFTAMRSRGARVTDIVVLVVAADDGVMPQTLEAINHAKAAKVPIIVAINKIDKENAQPDRVKSQLAERGLLPEDWAGDTVMVPVSAHSGEGIDLLLENILIQAEVLELKANPARRAFGVVIESKVDRGRGTVMTVLVQNGTLRKGDSFLVGSTFGKVRALLSDSRETIIEAGPGSPVEVLGADVVPLAGDEFIAVDSEAEARFIAEQRAVKYRLKDLARRSEPQGVQLTVENFAQIAGEEQVKELAVIVKADVQGSAEAVSDAVERLGTDKVKVKVLHRGVGSVTENDVQLAVASKAVIVAFNVRAESRAQQMAEHEGVDLRYSRIIYEIVEGLEASIKGMKEPEFRERTLGRVEVREIFKVPRVGVVAGSYVVDGTIERGSLVRLLRDNRVVYQGKMGSLRRYKDDVREVAAGFECGIGIDGYGDIRNGDVIEVYKIEEIRQ